MSAFMFKRPPQPPVNFYATPSSLISRAEALVAIRRELEDKIVEDVRSEDATFQNVLLPLIHLENRIWGEKRRIRFNASTSPDKELRETANKAIRIMTDGEIDSEMREDIFVLVDAVKKKSEKLHPESEYYLEKKHQSYTKNGLGIPLRQDRDRYKEIRKRTSELGTMCSKNINGDTNGIWFTPEELEGIPEATLATLKRGDLENVGKLWLTFKKPDLNAALAYAVHSETRKLVQITSERRFSENIPFFRELIIARDEAARLLGYSNHAAFKIGYKMTKTVDRVTEFLEELRRQESPKGQLETQKLLNLKAEHLKSRGLECTNDHRLYIWDHPFYHRMNAETEHSSDQNKIAEYFPLDKMFTGLCGIFEHLFGISFTELTHERLADLLGNKEGQAVTWHTDVKAFMLWDDEEEGGEFLGYLYMDLFPREGKYTHAGQFTLQPGYIQEDGTRSYPVAALVMNFSKPTATKPSLLKPQEIRSLFHELGHAMHCLLSRTKYAAYHGTWTDKDFSEVPSMMLENFFWQFHHIKDISFHYSRLSPAHMAIWKQENPNMDILPPEKIPDDMAVSIIETNSSDKALLRLRQLHMTVFDMTIHTPERHQSIEDINFAQLWNRLRKEIVMLCGPEELGEGYEWGHGYTTFRHVVGSYDAGYYVYLLSQVYSLDLFCTAFQADTMNAKEGRRYRYAVLQPGGSQDEMTTMENFLGRKPNSDAFFKNRALWK